MTAILPGDLRPIDLFAELTDDELTAWAQAARPGRASAGTVLAEQGVTATGLVLILEGVVEAVVQDGHGDEPVGDHVAPTWMGAINSLSGTPSAVRMTARTDVRLARIEPEAFVELAVAHRPVLRRVIGAIRPVARRLSALEANRERLASLGTMAAGLAHELNNPAAAASRAASDLADALEVLASTVALLVESGVEREQAATLVALQREAAAAAALRPVGTGGAGSALDAADAEDAVTDALEQAGIADGWRIAEPLTAAGVDGAFVARVAASAGAATPATLRWIAASLGARELVRELGESTERMSTLVRAIKTYAYMDRGALVEVDLREGLETTVTILSHKLKHTRIEVVRDYDPELAPVTVYGAELNQVWTNLIDNAIDALGETGTITLRTRRDGDCAEVEIADDGPGIPTEIRDRLFDPFFTTKPVGQGTGLGLDTARRIVVDRHRGSLTVDSAPGATVFRVRLPRQVMR